MARKDRLHPSDIIPSEDVLRQAKYFNKGRKNLLQMARPGEAGTINRFVDDLTARAKNIEGHDEMTRKSMADVKRRKLKADAEAPGAGLYAKARAKLNEATGFKKGGSASKRADGIAQKGKTKGRMV